MKSIKDKLITIEVSSPLNVEDITSLTLLYGPLLDSESIKLYLTFVSLCTNSREANKDFTHLNMFDLLSLTENKFLSSRYKLEALDLLLTYEGENDIIYIIHKPQSAKQFIKSGILGVYLNNKIGEDNLKKVVKVFSRKLSDLETHKNVSKTFDEVFCDVDVSKKIDTKFDLVDNVVAKRINITKSNFDFDKFVKNIDIHYIPQNKIDSFRQKVINEAHLYSLDETDMTIAYNKACEYFEFDTKVFLNQIKKIYNEKNNKKVISVKQNEIDEYYEELKNIEVIDLLTSLNINPTSFEISKVSEIYHEVPLEKASVNLLITYVVKEKKEIPSAKYFVSMFNTLSEKGILDFNSIKSYLFDKKTKTSKVVSKKKEDVKSSWADNNMNDFLKGLTNE